MLECQHAQTDQEVCQACWLVAVSFEIDVDALAAPSVIFDRLHGLVVQAVVSQAASMGTEAC